MKYMLQHFLSNSIALATKFEYNLQSTTVAFMETCFSGTRKTKQDIDIAIFNLWSEAVVFNKLILTSFY
jgi:hypothetical protein